MSDWINERGSYILGYGLVWKYLTRVDVSLTGKRASLFCESYILAAKVL